MGHKTKRYTESQLARRSHIEAELSSIPTIHPATRKLISVEGFIDYYLEMKDVYSSRLEAYERLEEFHVAITGRRRYSEFESFHRVVRRYLKGCAAIKPVSYKAQ